jgi:hypothetical protein
VKDFFRFIPKISRILVSDQFAHLLSLLVFIIFSLTLLKKMITNATEEAQESLLVGSTSFSIMKQARWSAKQNRPYIISAILMVAMSICVIIIYHTFPLREERLRGTFGECGTSPAEARSLGCQFDAMSFSWLPSGCYDAELVDDFLALRDWEWFYDAAGQHAIPKEEVLKGELTDLIVTREYHLFHCTYQWRKMHRGMVKGVIDSYIANYEHTAHCEHMLTEGVPMNTTDTVIVMKFPQCQYI